MARLLFRERYSPVEVRPGQTPAHSQPLIPYTTTRDTIVRPMKDSNCRRAKGVGQVPGRVDRRGDLRLRIQIRRRRSPGAAGQQARRRDLGEFIESRQEAGELADHRQPGCPPGRIALSGSTAHSSVSPAARPSDRYAAAAATSRSTPP